MKQLRPPNDFNDAHRKLWVDAQRELRKQGTWRNTDAPLLELMVRNVILARTARALAEGEPFVLGGNKQLTAHPGLGVADRAEAQVLRCATALILTPEARARHGVRAPDKSDAVFGELGLVEVG